jgi:ribonucleoside-diphosphate reductase alpha chain
MVPDPKSVPSASELMTQLDLGVAPPAPRNDVTDPHGLARPPAALPDAGVRHSDAPMCMQCGVQMIPAGSCHACPSCGNTSGCS